ncbi:MAG: hypothetical protein Q8S73_05605 [Deltaproteobacteria bacterium]|nr:hypothetical protein [Myxococcales bacterium]MDP3213558.1 hypothetical protein [Deltaproteobacteria bacterium]
MFDAFIPPATDMPFLLREPLDGAIGLGPDCRLLMWEEGQWNLHFNLKLPIQLSRATIGEHPKVLLDTAAISTQGESLGDGWFRLALKVGDRGRVDINGPIEWHVLFHVIEETRQASFELTIWESVPGRSA